MLVQAQIGSSKRWTLHNVREFYISRDINLSSSSAEDSETPRFSVQSASNELELPKSSSLPPSADTGTMESELCKFQIQCSLESSINKDVLHKFTQGLYAVTHLSSKFALPKSRVAEKVGSGLTRAAKNFTMTQWETTTSYSLEVFRYKNTVCSFLVSFFFPFFVSPFIMFTYLCHRYVLIEGVIQVSDEQSLCLTTAVYLAG